MPLSRTTRVNSPRSTHLRRALAAVLVAGTMVGVPLPSGTAAPRGPEASGSMHTPRGAHPVDLNLRSTCTANGSRVQATLTSKRTTATAVTLTWSDGSAPAVDLAAGATETRILPVTAREAVTAVVGNPVDGVAVTRTVGSLPCGQNVFAGGGAAGRMAASGLRLPALDAAFTSSGDGAITGRVTDTSGRGIEGICVEAWSDAVQRGDYVEGDALGNYSLALAPADDYWVQFWDCRNGEYLAEVFDDKENLDAATSVSVSSGVTTSGIDAVLEMGGRLSGMVTDTAGERADRICVTAWSDTLGGSGTFTTSATGEYVLPGLRSSNDWQVLFRDCSGPGYDTLLYGSRYATELWNDQRVWEPATLITVSAPEVVTGIDAVLSPAGSISGTITYEATGGPISEVCVAAVHEAGSGMVSAAVARTDTDGFYELPGLATATYKIQVWDCRRFGDLGGEFYSSTGNAWSIVYATPVDVAAPQAITGKDLQLTRGASVTGTVTDGTTGEGASAVSVEAHSVDGTWVARAGTEPDGTYTLRGLSATGYILHFEDFGSHQLPGEYWDDATTPDLATPVTPAEGAVVTGIDAVLGDAPVVEPAGLFHPRPPVRLLDTRYGTGVQPGTVPAYGSVELQVAGGAVPDDAGAAVLNVTVTEPEQAGYVTAYPSDVSRPTVSNLNFEAKQTIPNHVTVKLSADGRVTLYNGSAGAVHLIADVSGWYVGGTPNEPGALVPVTPTRVLDTRYGTGATRAAVPAKGKLRLQVAGTGPVPASGAAAVALNVTVTRATGAGYVTVYPGGTTMPYVSNLNFVKGQTIPNAVTVKLGSDGYVELYNGSNGNVHLIADVAGWVRDGTATAPGSYTALAPKRMLDTRSTTAIAPHQTLELMVAGRGGVATVGTSKAAVLNVTVTEPESTGYLTVYPGYLDAPLSSERPTASNLNFVKGQTIPNLVTVMTGDDGKVRFYNGSPGTVHVIADVAGYYR